MARPKKAVARRQDLVPAERYNELIADCCRFAEGIFTEEQVKKRWHLGENDWDALGRNDQFIEDVEEEKRGRMFSGSAKREAAQSLIMRAPHVLGTFMDDPNMAPKSRIESIKGPPL